MVNVSFSFYILTYFNLLVDRWIWKYTKLLVWLNLLSFRTISCCKSNTLLRHFDSFTPAYPLHCPSCNCHLPYRPGRQWIDPQQCCQVAGIPAKKLKRGRRKKNLWPNFGWFYQKLAEKGPQKIFKRSSLFLAVITTYNVHQDKIKFDF